MLVARFLLVLSPARTNRVRIVREDALERGVPVVPRAAVRQLVSRQVA